MGNCIAAVKVLIPIVSDDFNEFIHLVLVILKAKNKIPPKPECFGKVIFIDLCLNTEWVSGGECIGRNTMLQ